MDSLTTNTVFYMSTQNNQKSTRFLTGQTSSQLLPHVFSNVTQTQEGRVQTVHSPRLKL